MPLRRGLDCAFGGSPCQDESRREPRLCEKGRGSTKTPRPLAVLRGLDPQEVWLPGGGILPERARQTFTPSAASPGAHASRGSLPTFLPGGRLLAKLFTKKGSLSNSGLTRFRAGITIFLWYPFE